MFITGYELTYDKMLYNGDSTESPTLTYAVYLRYYLFRSVNKYMISYCHTVDRDRFALW